MGRRIVHATSAFFFAVMLSSCAAPTATDQGKFDDELFSTKGGGKLSVNLLKDMYTKETGENMVTPDALSCKWNSSCYYNVWAESYDKSINAYRTRQREQHRRDEIKKCEASPNCAKDRAIDAAVQKLNITYSVVLAQNPYMQAEYDGVIRMMCRKSGEAQRDGVSLEQLMKNLDSVEGVAPQDRRNMKDVAESCWTLSKHGISNGNEKIRTW